MAPKRSKQPLIITIVSLILLIGLGLIVFQPFQNSDTGTTSSSDVNYQIKFQKEGKLAFINADGNQDTLTTIDVEIANNEYEIKTGLKHRDSLPSNSGMLFIFPNERSRSFWMDKTKISLDIIFVNAQKTILTIQRNTQPYSQEGIPSNGKAKYVIEVPAGYCHENNIEVGDRIRFKKDNQET